MELAIFVAFLWLQFAAKALPEWFKHHDKLVVIMQRLGKNHYLVWLAHPAVIHAVHDYAVHFVVYSGYVIGSH